MSKPHTIVLLLAISGMLVHNVTPQTQRPTKPNFVEEDCDFFGSITDYDPERKQASNVRAVVEELQNERFKTFYHSTSSGTGETRVYGQYYCRGDIDSNLCGKCVEAASQSRCIQAGLYAIVWYEECTLRCDNRSMVGINEVDTQSPSSYTSSSLNVTNNDKFGSVLNNIMDSLISKAAYGNGSLRFATREGTVSKSETAYCLVQCSPDLNRTQCETCLQSAYEYLIPSNGTKWLRWMSMYYSSCQVRYTTYGAFYWQLHASPPGLSPSLVPSLPGPPVPDARGKNASYYVVRAVIPAVVVGLLTVLGISFCLIQRNRVLTSSSQRRIVNKPTTVVAISETTEAEAAETGALATECLQFDLKTIEDATNSFSLSNKLGQGGFGSVYQGILIDGKDIAVKRLSKYSGQGVKEFKTEVALVAKLQHKNLVRLVGCCVDQEERLLVYEFLHNLSLDRFLYDATRLAYLTWGIRHKIIQGISRGLHYLHEDSRVKIVHRDLKISNILLDDNLEPKIADFGLAKLVKVDQTADNTTKVVGTYGYMAPEYALAGRYSTKSDVYSFGVMVLEILSGKSNNLFYEIYHSEGLLCHAWRVWNEGAVEKLIDPILHNNYSRIEAERCLQIGLLCVQDDETNRPTMHSVLIMLNRTIVDLPHPFSPSHSSYN